MPGGFEQGGGVGNRMMQSGWFVERGRQVSPAGWFISCILGATLLVTPATPMQRLSHSPTPPSPLLTLSVILMPNTVKWCMGGTSSTKLAARFAKMRGKGPAAAAPAPAPQRASSAAAAAASRA